MFDPSYDYREPKDDPWKKSKDWKNSCCPRHFMCRCIMLAIPRGYKVDQNGSLVALADGEEIKIEKG